MQASKKLLAPGFLIATPQLTDSQFAKAVVLMVEHSSQGSMGLVINQTAPLTFRDLGRSQDLSVADSRCDEPLLHGGPVEPFRGFLIHDSPAVEERNEIVPGLFLSTTNEALSPLLLDESVNLRFFLGYAGWGPGQLEDEVKQGSWLVTEAQRDVILHDEPRQIWEQAIRGMGINPGWLMTPAGVN